MGEPILIYGMARRRADQSFQNFVRNTLSDAKPRGKAYYVGKADRVIARDMKKKGLSLLSDNVIIEDNTVLKYISHAKSTKGATLSFKEYWKVPKLVKSPTHIYEDKNQKELVYVITTRYSSGKVLKVVVHPNYTKKGEVYTVIKSIGIVNKTNMANNKQYRKIK